MPKFAPGPDARRTAAILAIDGYLCSERGGRALTTAELARYPKRHFSHGWRVLLSAPAEALWAVDVLVDGNFPYSAPRVATPLGPAALERPHVEADSLLCVFPQKTTISAFDPVGVAKELLASTEALFAHWQQPSSSEDFRDEFLSYWPLALDARAQSVVSLVSPNGPTRRLNVWRRGDTVVCADDRASLERWLGRFGAQIGPAGVAIHEGVLLWLPQALLPSEYPKTVGELLELGRRSAPESIRLIERNQNIGAEDIVTVLGMPTRNGVCFCAITIPRPDQKALQRGFRPNRVPARLAQQAHLGPSRAAVRNLLRRMDHAWIHGRDQDSTQNALRKKRVLLIGCGALGSGIARHLAQSGVGNFSLVDSQNLEPPNTSRHTLGASSVPQNKAVALAAALQKDLPHLGEIEAHELEFGLSSTALIDGLSAFDLIISATGDWKTDALLNDLQRAGHAVPRILYAWLEPHAIASHALLIAAASAGGCLRCGFDSCGVPLAPVAAWPHGEVTQQEPSCGGEYSAFGAVDLAWGQALASELALDALLRELNHSEHRIWIGRRETLQRFGGIWSTSWSNLAGDPKDGGFTIRRPWSTTTSCAFCSQSIAA